MEPGLKTAHSRVIYTYQGHSFAGKSRLFYYFTNNSLCRSFAYFHARHWQSLGSLNLVIAHPNSRPEIPVHEGDRSDG